MSAPLFLLEPGALEGVRLGGSVVLDGPEGRHAATVRRTRVGEHLLLTDGAGLRVEGEVVAVGPGKFEDGQRTPMDVAGGDKVIYSKYGGTEVKYAGEELLILSARDILAVVVK